MFRFDGDAALDAFIGRLVDGTVDVYNEVSLQLELGLFLRTWPSQQLLVELERPAYHFGAPRGLTKTEIDIVVRSPGSSGPRWAIELKFPRNGQHPEQMFAACKDLRFLEELCASGFAAGWFLMLVDSPLFYAPARNADGIYRHFRAGVPIEGEVQKPTGDPSQCLRLQGSYTIAWRDAGDGRRVAVVRVGGS